MVEDVIEVTQYLLKRFNKDKIFIAGHSWGTFLGTLAISNHPEYFHAYIGIGQINDFTASEQASYDFMLSTATAKNDSRAIQRIKSVPFDDNFYKNSKYGQLKSKYINKYGGGFKRDGYSTLQTLKDVFTCPNYNIQERLNIMSGSLYSYHSLSETLATTILTDSVQKLEVPVFILHGIHDYQTTYFEGKRFYELIDAPMKKLYTFEHSAHAPFLDETDEFYRVLNEIKQTVNP